MSIEKNYGRFQPMCDACGHALEEHDDFYDAVSAKKAAGWKIQKIGEDWIDTCTNCVGG